MALDDDDRAALGLLRCIALVLGSICVGAVLGIVCGAVSKIEMPPGYDIGVLGGFVGAGVSFIILSTRKPKED